MKQEDKELLLKDLCARLPYGVKLKHYQGFNCLLKYINLYTFGAHVEVLNNECFKNILERGRRQIFEFKPYLRPISSMTEEEVNKLFHILKINEKNANEWIKVNDIGTIRLFTEEGKDFYEIADAINYLHSIHIDYSGLIEKGLAIEAPTDMYI